MKMIFGFILIYRNGKVCLSLLNSWQGEQWTSCQTIRTILLHLVTLFHNKPLLNEPGIKEDYKYFKRYNEIIQFANYNTAVLSVLKNKISKHVSDRFKDEINEYYHKNKDDILKKIKTLSEKKSKKIIKIGIYSNMQCFIDYKNLYKIFSNLIKKNNKEQNNKEKIIKKK